jgi:hypothetical protein
MHVAIGTGELPKSAGFAMLVKATPSPICISDVDQAVGEKRSDLCRVTFRARLAISQNPSFFQIRELRQSALIHDEPSA